MHKSKFQLSVLVLFLIAACSEQLKEFTSNLPLSFSVEQTGSDCNIPAMPHYDELEEISHLPDPFLSMNGTQISDIDEWRCRRAEIAAQLKHYELGDKPAAPETVSGSLTSDTLRVEIEVQGKTISFDSEIILPQGGNPPYPAIIGIGRSFLDNAQLDSLGVAIINFPNNILAEQQDSGSRGKGKFYDLYGSDHTASAMMAWAWGVSRLIDLLETTDTPIDVERLGVTGCSRNGKGALVAGAFDERIVLTIPQESGSGGAAGWRVSDAQLESGQNVQTLRQIVDENVWFADHFSKFSDSAEKLPFDHHELMGMIAPRALLVLEHSGIEWLGAESTFTTSLAAREIWKAMDIADRIGISQVSGHNHCQLPESQKPHVAAFVKAFLLNDPTADTQIIETDGDFTHNAERWIPWDTPDLR